MMWRRETYESEKIEYAWYIIRMHGLKFILQDKKKKNAPLCLSKVGPSGWLFLRSKP